MADFFSKLSSNLGDLGKIISEKAEEVSKKTEDAVEVQKITDGYIRFTAFKFSSFQMADRTFTGQ